MKYLNKRLIRVALGEEPADTVVKGGRLINVFTGRLENSDVAIAEGRVAAIGEVDYTLGDNTEVIDAADLYLAPGLIEGHIHVEVTKLTPANLANAALVHGTTSLMTPLDQVGVVAGIDGMRWILDQVQEMPIKIFHSSPSRLPYTTPASTIAHRFGPEQHKVSQQWPEAVGIWEYMTDSITDFDEPVFEVAEMTLENRLGLHGHAPVVRDKALSAHVAAGMANDHEAYTPEELAEKLRNGVSGIIRRGTHSDNVPELVRVVTEMGFPTDRLALCTDDLDCVDFTELGLIDYLVRYVIQHGIDPIAAIQMGTVNAADIYKVSHWVGSVAPGRYADILFVSDLPNLTLDAVMANGKIVAREGEMVEPVLSSDYPPMFLNTMHLNEPKKTEDLYIAVDQDAVEVDVLAVHLEPEEGLLSQGREATLQVEDGRVMPDPEQDVLYITVTDRHSGKGLTGKGFISGFGLKKGAIATSLSPDDDNIICIGADVNDMAVCINHLVEIGGGQCAAEGGKVLADIPLPICGLMADISAEEMADQERALNAAAHSLGSHLKRPFFFIIFLSITAIPDYAMTDRGMVEHATRQVINPVKEVRSGERSPHS